MKNLLLNERVFNIRALFCILLVGLFFSIIKPTTVSAQNGGTVVTGQVFVYQSTTNEQDTTGLVGQNVYVKFYTVNNSNQLMFLAQAPVDSTGFYSVKVYTSEDLYVILPPNDPVEDNFAATFYPGWLDFESADVLKPANNGDTLDYDWGAVGKEIVERPSAGAITNTITGKVNTAVPYSYDFVPTAYLLNSEGNVVASAPVASDGRYNLSFTGSGNYEVFTSVPGFASQSKYISFEERTKSNLTVDFNLDVYRGGVETTPVNAIPSSFTLSQNYPNPFNPTTKINFTVNTTGLVKLTVYNSQGKEVTKLVNDLVAPGSYDITFNGANLASGIYYYTLQVGNEVVTKRMNLIK